MAKLADALASGASGREVVQVQVLFRAQKRNATRFSGGISLLCSPEYNLCPVERRSHSGALRRESRPVQKLGTGRTPREIPLGV